MKMIRRKCKCKTWERHQQSECRIQYDVCELLSSHNEWDQEFSDKWQIEYDPEEYFLLPEDCDFERDPLELAIENGNLILGKDHPLFMRAMSATLNDDEDEILCQFLFDEKKTLDIGKSLGMTKLAVVRKIYGATKKVQSFCRNHPTWFKTILVTDSDGPYTETTMQLAA